MPICLVRVCGVNGIGDKTRQLDNFQVFNSPQYIETEELQIGNWV